VVQRRRRLLLAERALGMQVDEEVNLVVEPWPGLVFNRLADGSRRLQHAQHCILSFFLFLFMLLLKRKNKERAKYDAERASLGCQPGHMRLPASVHARLDCGKEGKELVRL
jgi:hypothetical protein